MIAPYRAAVVGEPEDIGAIELGGSDSPPAWRVYEGHAAEGELSVGRHGGGLRGDQGCGLMLRPVQQTAATVTGWLQEERRVAAGTLVAVDGSSPLDVGASVYIDEHGTIEGSVTGGCVESAVAQEAMAILAEEAQPRLVSYGISDELAGTVGLMCGGTVHIFIHELRGDARAATLEALTAIHEARPAALATLLDGEHAGAKLYVDADGAAGSLGGSELLERNVAQEARGLTAQGRSLIRAYGEDGASLGSGLRVHIAAFAEPPRMVIFGAIDFASALAPLAKGLGYRVTIADPRGAFLESPRFSTAAETVVAWPDRVLSGMTLGPRDAVLVFTHDPKLDVPAVQAALASGAGYIGALGSRKTTADRNRRLREVGVADEDIARVYAPCGLDIGSSTVEETAVAVLAEIIARRTGREGQPLRRSSGPIRRDSEESAELVGPGPQAGEPVA
jgi:xanthine dehydrogenase accessory factor